jgi:hypothetical protein
MSGNVLEARTIAEDGKLGTVLAVSTRIGDSITHEGSNVIVAQLAAMAASGRRSETEAFDLLMDEPWSNGKTWIGAAES